MNQLPRLFVYGSLRVGFHNPAYTYLSKYFRLIGEGTVNGKFYFNGVYPVAVPAEGRTITGDLYELNDSDDFSWVLVQLDDYEGINVEPGEIPLYTRQVTEITIKEEKVKAWIYWYNRSVEDMVELDATEIASYLLQQKNSK